MNGRRSVEASSGPANDHRAGEAAASSIPPHLRATAAPPSAAQVLLRAVIAAGIYWGAGRLALLMAIPPGYATAVWPAAGLALACCLKWGLRVAPGIAIGSFCVNIATSFDASSSASIARSVAIALGIGIGAAAQAALGSLGIRRYVGSPTPLESVRDVSRFTFIGGPVACTVAASVGVSTLCAAGVIPWQNFAFSWATWWVGDTIGVLIFAPLALILTSGSSQVRQERRLIVALPLLLGFGLVTMLFLRASAWEAQRLRVDFERRAAVLASSLETTLSEYEEVVGSLSSLLHVMPDIDRAAFRQFTRRPLGKYPALQALGWNPIVAHADRARFEATARAQGYEGFELKELDESGKLRTAAARRQYVVAYYVEPEENNRVALGFDVASEAQRENALQVARAAPGVAATARVSLIQTQSGDPGVLLFSPVFSQSRGVSGYTVAAFRMRDVVDNALKGFEHADVALRVADLDGPKQARVLFGDPKKPQAATDEPTHTWMKPMLFGQRHWSVEVTAKPEYMTGHRSWQAWMVLAGGLFFVGLLGVVMLIATGRTSISQEIAARFGALVESSAQIVWAANAAGEMVEDSASWRAFTGRTYPQWRGRGWLDALHPDDRKNVEQQWKQALKSKTSLQTEYRIRHASGAWRWTAARAVPLLDEVGSLRAWVGMNTDVTEQKLLTDQFRLAIAASPIGMLMIDRQGAITLANHHIETLLGYARGELVGKSVETLLPQAPGSKLFARCKDGSEVSVEVTLTPLHTPDGDFVLGSVVDIRERERAEREREELLNQLKAFNTELEERVQSRTRELSAALNEREVMLQEIHHRVKNNLQVIASLINMQMRRMHEEASKEALEECKSRIHAIALIHEILYRAHDYAHVRFSEYAAILTRTVLQGTGLVPSDVELSLAMEDVALPVDRAIPCGLILNELVTNALKHAFPNARPGTITVELARVGSDKVRLAVRDDGRGLPETFDLTKPSSVGLQLVATLAEQLGATLEVSSEGGTAFVLTLPLNEPS